MTSITFTALLLQVTLPSAMPIANDDLSITLSRVPGKAVFNVTAANRSNKPVAFCKYPWAWEVKLFDAKGGILSNEAGYRRGGIEGGTVYHAPSLRVTTRYDWTVLMPGEQISFIKGVFRTQGQVTSLNHAMWAELNFVERDPASITPSWIDKSEVKMMMKPSPIRIALR